MDEKKIKTIMSALNLNRHDAIELLEFDAKIDRAKGNEIVPGEVVVPKLTKTGTKKGITDEELEQMTALIKAQFADKDFKNKDLTLIQEELNLTARQTPSRLKKLVGKGILKDLGGSPKSYKLV